MLLLKIRAMTDIKFAAFWAAFAALVALAAFAVNFWVMQGSFPGYKILVYPGILVTRLFSEEIEFWQKLGIMLIGQYLLCFVLFLSYRKLVVFIGAILR